MSRTFSKAYGLAGLRIGYGLMDAAVAGAPQRRAPAVQRQFHRPGAALAALADGDYVAESAALNRAGLHELGAALDAMGIEYVPSHGNFLLIRVGDAAAIYARLLRQGVIVRPVA